MSIDNDPVRIMVTGARGWDNWAVPKDALLAGMNLMRTARPRRNAEMIASGADLVLGFPMHRMGTSGREASKGTWDAIKTADAAKATVYVIWNQQLFPFNQKAGRLLAATEKATHHMGQVDLSDLI